MTKKVVLHSNCLLVKGANRSVICDVQLQTIHYIPNSLYDILENHSGKSLEEIKQIFDNKYDDVIDEYFRFLLEKECVFYTNTPERFPPMNLQWHYPHKISNAIIDYNTYSSFNIHAILEQLDHIRCKSIQIRFFSKIDKSLVISILQKLKDIKSIITSVELIVKSSDWTDIEEVEKLYLKFPRLTGFNIHSANEKKILPFGNKYIVYTNQIINSESHCGIISMNYFSINLKAFTESKHHNSCLNRKVSIDTNGDIRNCPSMPKSFGNINNTSIEEALEHEDFKKYWNITKDKINICKDCEFRYVCTDCRAYKENPQDDYSKPLKCGYSPYTNEWEKWSQNPLKDKAIKHYGLLELIDN
ncbi:grasp-with-spasm system SPASM domain peptide maturase [Ascidiimonas aurantiaca]|uniref:grasp-with-spasm system SPASM domain peptide maturase n=1 Tax=Ascidiimonas aurantiaca TaxID=1685432 RepID=UPI0030EF0AF0